MGSLVKKSILLIIFSFLFSNCSLLEKGYTDEHNQYVPKRPNFKLKDKKGGVLLPIDTLAVYKMVEMYKDGELIYQNNSNKELQGFEKELNNSSKYIKFYKGGRCLIFSILSKKNSLDTLQSIKKEDLNPNNDFYSKKYYFNSNGRNIEVEGFAYGAGQGHYVISNYVINEKGDLLVNKREGFKTVFKKEPIPVKWHEMYPVDW